MQISHYFESLRQNSYSVKPKTSPPLMILDWVFLLDALLPEEDNKVTLVKS